MSDTRLSLSRPRTNWAAYVPDLPGCITTGPTLEDTERNIREAIELFLETLTDEERSAALSQEILTTFVEVHA